MKPEVDLILLSGPNSPEEWHQWLLAKEEEKCRLYLADNGDQLVADCNNEQGLTHDYEGREILELLQNAGDAAAEAGIQGKVAIDLRRDGIVVSNTGFPFSAGGINSLRTAHLSPKRLNQKLLVGEKGLGFRSILNWTRTPLIQSGALQLVFCKRYARKVFSRLCEASPALSENVARYQEDPEDLFMPTLVFPAFSEDGEVDKWLDTPGLQTIHKLCSEYRNAGYNTTVGMPFYSEAAFEIAESQIEELKPEFLLFVDSLSEICIRIEGHNSEQVWRKQDSGNGQVDITHNDEVVGSRRVYDFGSEEIPKEHRDEEGKEQAFQVVLAAPTEPSTKSNFLFTYFPTELEMPLPVLCHATLRLEGNRKHPTQGAANQFIFQRMAARVVEVAEAELRRDGADRWAGIRLISLTEGSTWSAELNRVGFGKALKGAVKRATLFPTLDGEFYRPSDVRYLPGAASSWLPKKAFPTVIDCSGGEQAEQLVSRFSIDSVEVEDFINQCLSANLELQERVTLICGMVKAGLGAKFCDSRLLADTEGNAVPEDSTVFLTPVSDIPEIPSWATLRFLNREIRDGCSAKLEIKDARELQQTLRNFGVVEFSRANLIQRLIAEANRQIRSEGSNEEEIRRELLACLFRFFQQYRAEDSVPQFPKESSIRLRAKSGEFLSPEKLYLSVGYGVRGKILEGLYGSWSPERMVVPGNELGFEGDLDFVAEFLKWMGVADLPREISSHGYCSEFRRFLVHSLAYPAKFGDDYQFNNPDEVSGASVKEFKTVDGLNEIIESADSIAILGWLNADERVPSWGQKSTLHATLTAKKHRAWDARECFQPLPSYICWKLGREPWLPTTSGEKRAPNDCLIAEKIVEVVFPRPAADMEEDKLKEFGLLSAQDFYRACERAGALPGLDRLEREEIYQMMLLMPEKDPSGKAAKNLYKWLIENDDVPLGSPGRNYERFISEGSMWGRWGEEEGYYPVTELRHRDSEVFSKELMDHFKLVQLPARTGVNKVERLFGVKSLRNSGVTQTVKSASEMPGWELYADDFDEAKPYLMQLRQSQAKSAENLKTLERLTLVLCDELVVEQAIEDQTIEVAFDSWKALIDEETLFVCVDPKRHGAIPESMVADAVGAALAGLFELKDGDAFSKVFWCDSSDRGELLRNMCGDEVLEGIELKAATEELREIPIIEPIPVTVPSDPEKEPVAGTSPSDTETDSVSETQVPPSSGNIEVRPMPHVPDTAIRSRRLVVRRVSPGQRRSSTVRRVTDGDLCEKVILLFEEEQGRFPLGMGNIMGRDGAGCDVFSFATEEERQKFLENEPRDLSLVSRFIEVKGRGNSAANIELQGNEYETARRRRDRYFLYRVFQDRDRSYQIAFLQNPLHQSDAFAPAAVVNLDRAEQTERFQLSYASQAFDSSPENEHGKLADPTGLSEAN